MSETGGVVPVGQVWMVRLDDGREVHAVRMSDDTFTFLFINNGDKTMIRLSREAVGAMRALVLKLTEQVDA